MNLLLKGVFNFTLKDKLDHSITLLVDDGYNTSINTIRADSFRNPVHQIEHRKLRSIVEVSIGYAKGVIVNRNKFFPELQEAIILIAYELSQLKMMINPLRIEFLTEQVVESLRDSLNPSLFTLSSQNFLNKIFPQ